MSRRTLLAEVPMGGLTFVRLFSEQGRYHMCLLWLDKQGWQMGSKMNVSDERARKLIMDPENRLT